MADETTFPTRDQIDTSLVRRLIDRQFTEWASLPVRPVAHSGWDNRTFHLGDEMLVRLPSAAGYVQQVEKEHRWLPRLAPLLPLPIPVPLAQGQPDEGFPWPWSVYRWLEGEPAVSARIDDLPRFAADLAGFLIALQGADATDGPAPGSHNFHRGGPPAYYDAETRVAIDVLAGEFDPAATTAVWEAALAAKWRGEPVWFHGDIAVGNLLVRDGQLGAVIDFGTSGVGDPACDLAITWTFLHGEAREVFRREMPADDAMWARGRGWTLWKALIVAADLAQTNAKEGEISRHIIREVLADHAAHA